MEKSVRPHRLLKQVLLSFVLCFLTLLVIWVIDSMPHSTARDALSDALRFPAGLIVGVFYPEGIHTGSGSPQAAYIGFVGNIVFYSFVWFLVIRVVDKVRRSTGSGGQRQL